jgi:DNA-binding response OmpR family regulator
LNAILVLDDDVVFTELLQTVFQLEGYETVLVPSPAECAAMVRDLQPAVVLVDVHYWKERTFDLVRGLRADKTLCATPVLMTSGMDYHDESLAAGADAFLLKPFLPSDLIRLIERLIDRQDTGEDG